MRIEAVIWEAALRQSVGGPTVMAAQLAKLGELAAWPNVSIQILPLGCGAYPGMGFSFQVLSFAAEHYDDVVYVENLRSGTYLEHESEVEECILHFESLRETALDPDRSAGLIREIEGGPAA